LHITAKLGNVCVLEWILETWQKHGQSFDVDALNRENLTALFLVCQQGFAGAAATNRKTVLTKDNRRQIVQLLCSKGANVNF